MLIAFVLLGKNLEQRAKLKATSDMTGLLNILPSKARLMVDNDAEKSSLVEVPCDTLAVGDYVVVLPGVSTTYVDIGDIGIWFLVFLLLNTKIRNSPAYSRKKSYIFTSRFVLTVEFIMNGMILALIMSI
jgi:hypothetical protein